MEQKTIKRAKLHAKYRASQRKDVPWLNLGGLWLAKAGFNVGQKIEIKIEDGQLTIKAV